MRRTYGAGYPATEDRALPAVVYALYILGLFHLVTAIIAVIMATIGVATVAEPRTSFAVRLLTKWRFHVAPAVHASPPSHNAITLFAS
jgi:uncharacterized membrane protein